MGKLIDFAPSAAFYLLALAAQVSGFTNSMVAALLAVVATLLLLIPVCHRWHCKRIDSGRRGLLDPSNLIIVGLGGVIIFAAVALGGVIWQQMRAAPATPVVATHIQLGPEPTKLALSDFEWGFERHPGYPFVGMSADADKRILVHFFQAQGHNKTNDPIEKVRGYVRSDRTGKQYPIYFQLGRERASENEINQIPIGAIIDIRAPFLPDDALMPVQQFLNEVVPFTFFFEYDGKTYRRSFALAEIEPLIAQYEQEVRKSSVRPPQMSKKDAK